MNLLHVYNLPPVDNLTLRSHEQFLQFSHPEQLELLKEFYIDNISVESTSELPDFHVYEGPSISSAVMEKSSEIGADMVIVGRKDRQSKRGLLAGNIANALMDKLSCPLLVAPNDLAGNELKTIIYASDFEADDIVVLGQLNSLARCFDASIHVVHIPVRNEYSSSEQMDWFQELVTQKLGETDINFHLLLSKDVTEGLQSFLEQSEADLLCMLERDDKGFFSKLIEGDTVKKMKSICELPLLIYNRKSIA